MRARAQIDDARPLVPSHRQHVLDALERLLDAEPGDAQAWLERMGPRFVGLGVEQTALLALAGELKGAAIEAADARVIELMQPRTSRRRRAA